MNQIYPEPTVGALVVNGGNVLLVRSPKWFSTWTVPGGHIELGERIKDALKREVKEEVGLDVEVVKLLLIQEAIYSKNFYERKHFIFFDYLCRSSSSKVVVDEVEVQDYIWVSPNEALKMDLEPFTRRLVEEYIKTSGGE